ncbi:hypothetical protein D5R40_33650 [Okeania hirsuta]|uniref:Uncharacterized protein n=1 Tax=Okeania hirsuta TaxID=1458930 RepID=A0A3N6NZR4_9CYAN|nr:hypothetical protein D5R40_33650 [Okeania hirsuta]RQH23978.1 hypothetical protein D4Z78_05405 [Okeania hirsuta]
MTKQSKPCKDVPWNFPTVVYPNEINYRTEIISSSPSWEGEGRGVGSLFPIPYSLFSGDVY